MHTISRTHVYHIALTERYKGHQMERWWNQIPNLPKSHVGGSDVPIAIQSRIERMVTYGNFIILTPAANIINTCRNATFYNVCVTCNNTVDDVESWTLPLRSGAMSSNIKRTSRDNYLVDGELFLIYHIGYVSVDELPVVYNMTDTEVVYYKLKNWETLPHNGILKIVGRVPEIKLNNIDGMVGTVD